MRAAVLLLACLSVAPAAAAETPLVVADFDYVDTSGEPADQRAAHAERIAGFAELLRKGLDAEPAYAVGTMTCKRPPCTAGTMRQADFIQAVRDAGAEVVIYGGVHKMSTLVQMGKIHVLDVKAEKLILDRSFTFRGDNDMAYQRAADFMVEQILKARE